ncbi:MAG TPA: translation elongation factor Ts [Rhizomicrobium sp.]|jgi:elongation factor Ts|nr:translation elongation factor Ts [Rhizomicrobium sp.]
MSNITASMVKDLRDKTGAGMMDCKAALADTNGDMEAAIDWLRKKGISKAAKKASRVAAEGLIGVAARPDAAALVEVNSETDFVARNDQFKTFVKDAAALALEVDGDVDKLLAKNMGSAPVETTLREMIAKIGENMSVRRAVAIAVNPGVVGTYVHNAAGPELGKIGVLVALKSTADQTKLAALGRQLAMHIAAAAPIALTAEHIPAETIAREKAIHAEVARQSGKPEAVIEKMLEGRMRKYYEEVVLLQQTYVLDGETRIDKVLEKASKDLGAPVAIEGFVRFQVGEGIEKTDGDFADEVSKLSGV